MAWFKVSFRVELEVDDYDVSSASNQSALFLCGTGNTFEDSLAHKQTYP